MSSFSVDYYGNKLQIHLSKIQVRSCKKIYDYKTSSIHNITSRRLDDYMLHRRDRIKGDSIIPVTFVEGLFKTYKGLEGSNYILANLQGLLKVINNNVIAVSMTIKKQKYGDITDEHGYNYVLFTCLQIVELLPEITTFRADVQSYLLSLCSKLKDDDASMIFNKMIKNI